MDAEGREPLGSRRRRYKPKPNDEITRNMSAIRSSGNRTETELRKTLHRMGFRYRKYVRGLPGRPDIVFPREKVAVFVDGDYWHGRVLREQGPAALEARIKGQNKEYWMQKFRRNVDRDTYVTNVLRGSGWTVLRFWESELRKDVSSGAEVVAEAVRGRRSALDPLHRRRGG